MNHSIIIKFANRIQFLKSLIYFLSILLILGFSSAIAQSNYSLSFDGVDDYISITHSDLLNIDEDEITIEMWVNFQSSSPNDWFLGKQGSITGRILGLYLTSNLTFNGLLSINNQEYEVNLSNSHPIELARWYHIALTYNGLEMIFFIDGVPVGSYAVSGELSPSGNYNLYIGSNWNQGENAEMYIDEVRIWNVAHTQSEIQSKMYKSLDSSQEISLVGYWRFDEGLSNIVYDASGNGNSGTIYGATWSMDVPFYEDYFSPVSPTGLPYNIVIESAFINNNDLLPGDQIGAFDDTLCVGAITVYDSVENVNLVAWQGDPDHNLPGFIPSNLITFKVLSNLYGTAEVFHPGVTYSVGDGTFGYGSYSVVSLAVATIDVPEPTLNTTGIVFDPIPIYTTSTDSFIIQNNGDRNLVITDITSDNSAFTTSFSGSVIIITSASEVIYVTFSPDQETYYSATLTIISNDQTNSPAHISVSGLGTEQLVPDWIGFQNTLNLGSAVSGDTIQVNWTIQNSGSDTLRLCGIYTNSEHFLLDINGCQVPPGDIYLLPVYFAPDSRGLFTADLYFSHNDPDLGQNQIKFNAFGYDGYYQCVEPTGLPYTITVDSILVDYQCLDYGDEIVVFDDSLCVGMGVKGLDENLQITAWERDPSHVLPGFTAGNTMTFKFWGNTFGEDREISITSDFIQGDGSFGFQPLTVVNLSGFSGFSPIVQLSTTAITFDPTNVGYFSIETLLITNIGNAKLEVNYFQFTSSAFYSNASSLTIAPGTTYALEIYFSPDQPVYYSEELTFNTDDPDHHFITVQLTGIGIPSLQSHLTVVNPLLEFIPTVIGDTSTAEIIIRNDGNAPLTINSITSTSNAFFTDVHPIQINSGVSKVFPIHFVPDSKGSFNSSFQIYSEDAGNGNVHYFPVQGTGYKGYLLPVQPTGLPYHIVIDSISTFNDSFLKIGDEIGIYDKHLCVGAIIVEQQSIASGNKHSLSFDGVDDYISVPDIADWNFGSGDFVIDFWMTLSNLDLVHDGLFARNDFQWIAMEYNHDGDRTLNLWIDANGASGWEFVGNGVGTPGKGTKTDWVSGQWYHIAIVRNGNTVKVYVDGQEDASGNYTATVYNPSGVPLYIGRSQLSNRNHHGLIDEVRIWNRALTEQEIQSKINQILDPSQEIGLVGYWRFNEGTGDIAYDLSGNNGTIYGATWSTDTQVLLNETAISSLSGTAWQKDESHSLSGFTEGDSINFVVRTNLDAFPDSTADTYYASTTYSEEDGLFGNGEMSVLDLSVTAQKLDASLIFNAPELAIEDFYFNEDETLTVYLDDIVNDPDTPNEEIEWLISFEPIDNFTKNVSYKNTISKKNISKYFAETSYTSCLHYTLNIQERILTFYGEPNYFIDSVRVYYAAIDNRDLTALDSNLVTILSVNDPPVVPDILLWDIEIIEDQSFVIDLRNFYNQASDVETPIDELIWTLQPGNSIFIDTVLDSNIYIITYFVFTFI